MPVAKSKQDLEKGLKTALSKKIRLQEIIEPTFVLNYKTVQTGYQLFPLGGKDIF